jgi:DNA-binding transcriptional ArsR family regulator
MLCFGEFTGKHAEKWQFMKNGNLDESIMARLPDTENEQSKVTTVLRAIGNSKRLRILNELADDRERSVSELEAIISNLSQSALSQHLSRLRRANIVRTRRESQTIYYSIEDTDVLRILRLLSHIYDPDPVMRPRQH